MSSGTVAAPNDIVRLAAMPSMAPLPQSVNEDAHTIEACIYSGAPIARFDYRTGRSYEMIFDPSGCDTTRVEAGSAAVVDSHQTYSVASQLGVVKAVQVLKGKVYATLQISRRPETDGIWTDLKDGALRGVSLGAIVLESNDELDDIGNLKTRTVTRWQLFEVSLVVTPADHSAVTLSINEVDMNGQQQRTTGTAAPAPAGPVQLTLEQENDVRARVKLANLPASFADDFITRRLQGEDVSNAIIGELALRHQQQPETRAYFAMTRDHSDGRMSLMVEGVSARLTGKDAPSGAREYAAMRMPDIARQFVENRHVSDVRAVELALSTSDFPKFLTSAGERMMLDAYRSAEPAIKKIARRGTVNDYRAKSILQMSQTPSLEKVNENGEITSGSMVESGQSFSVDDYARIISLSNKALANDDLGAWADLTRKFGVSAAQREAQCLIDLLTMNSGLGPVLSDGATLFHATHKNLGSTAAIAVSSLSEARKLMRLQTDLDGTTIIDVQPRFLVVPANQESQAEQFLAEVAAADPVDVNPFSNRLQLIVEPRLDQKSPTRWYVFGESSTFPVLEYAYINGEEGVQVTSRVGFERLGIDFRAVLTFGCGAVDWRGAVTNAGV